METLPVLSPSIIGYFRGFSDEGYEERNFSAFQAPHYLTSSFWKTVRKIECQEIDIIQKDLKFSKF